MKKIIALFLSLFFLYSCNNTKEASQTVQKNHPIIESTDFFAESEENDWKLSVLLRDQIVFTHQGGTLILTPKEYTFSKINERTLEIKGIKGKQEIHILIEEEACAKGQEKVIINLKDKKGEQTFEDCGYYRGAPQLHDIWVVYQIDDEELSQELFPNEFPHLEINLVEQRISGFAGCNQVHGMLDFGYDKIYIQGLVSTRMYCEATSKTEERILSILRTEPYYTLKDTILTLTSTEGTLHLKKID